MNNEDGYGKDMQVGQRLINRFKDLAVPRILGLSCRALRNSRTTSVDGDIDPDDSGVSQILVFILRDRRDITTPNTLAG